MAKAGLLVVALTQSVSPLFPDIIQCMAIQVLEIKKSERSSSTMGTSAHVP